MLGQNKFYFLRMRVTFYCVAVLALISQVNCEQIGNSAKSNIVRAISTILENYFEKNSWRVDFVIFGEKNGSSVRLLNEILKDGKYSITMQVLMAGPKYPWNYKLNSSTIVLFDSLRFFKASFYKIQWQTNTQARFRSLVYSPLLSKNDIENVIIDGFDIDYVNFLLEETLGYIDLLSSFMFSIENCRVNQLKVISRFDVSTFQWNNTNFYPNKYQNLFNCSLDVKTAQLDINQGSDEAVHPIRRILETLAQANKFRIGSYTWIGKNFHEILSQSKNDLFEHAHSYLDDQTFVASTVIQTDEFTYMVAQGEPYSALERMFLMFDLDLWIAIATTLLIGISTIQILNLTSIKVQNFVYGRYIRTPTLNFISIFLNGGQTRVPARNFARFFLMLFILWSLIIRTCYQSKLFEFLQADLRKSTIETLNELYEKNLTISGTLPKKFLPVFLRDPIERFVSFCI